MSIPYLTRAQMTDHKAVCQIIETAKVRLMKIVFKLILQTTMAGSWRSTLRSLATLPPSLVKNRLTEQSMELGQTPLTPTSPSTGLRSAKNILVNALVRTSLVMLLQLALTRAFTISGSIPTNLTKPCKPLPSRFCVSGNYQSKRACSSWTIGVWAQSIIRTQPSY